MIASCTGSAGDRISPSGSGARCEKTIAPEALLGIISRMTTRVPAPIVGARTASLAFQIATS